LCDPPYYRLTIEKDVLPFAVQRARFLPARERYDWDVDSGALIREGALVPWFATGVTEENRDEVASKIDALYAECKTWSQAIAISAAAHARDGRAYELLGYLREFRERVAHYGTCPQCEVRVPGEPS
jgi:hypothetical protein